MKSLFSGATTAPSVTPPSPAARGFNGLSGKAKLGAGVALAVGVAALVIVPGLLDRQPPQGPAKPEDQHFGSQINDYSAPPAPQNISARLAGAPMTNDTAPVQLVRRRPTATEMALYVPASGQREAAREQAPTSRDATDPGDGGGGTAGGQPDRLSASLSGATRLPAMRATLVRNPDFLIRAGATIPCRQFQAMNSSLPGFVTCRLQEWYPSSNLRRGLLPPGTVLFGQMRVGLSQGEERIGVIFTKIETPRFNIEMAAPAGDALGRTGLDADIKTFFWDKAAAVGLYALMDVAIGAGQNLASSAMSKAFNGGSGGTTLNLGSQSQGLASQQFGSTINRPPVGTRPEGTPLTVMVGQDLDFGDACRRVMAGDPMGCPPL